MMARARTTAESSLIRIILVDDHYVVRQGILANVISQPDMTVVGEASDGMEAIGVIKTQTPDIVLLDLRMPRMDGLDVLAHLRTMKLSCRVIILTAIESEEDIHRCIKAGAQGYLLKDSLQEEILDAIRRVHLGETYLPARIVQKVAECLRKPELSARELQVLQCVAQGKSNKEIGTQLFIGEGTVKTHVKSLLDKLGVPGRTAAIREALHRGLVRLN